MAICELTKAGIKVIDQTKFGLEGIKERADLQRVLRSSIGVVSPETMVIAEEFGKWEDSKRRIDLLGLDKQANLVVIELKCTEDGGHMELQAIRYAAMIAPMTFEQVVAAHAEFRHANGIEGDAQEAILKFLAWDEPDEAQFAQSVRIVLVSSDFSKEVTTAVMWLNQYDLDVKCVRLRPYNLDGRILLDVQQIIPLPEAAEYQVRIKEKAQKERRSKTSTAGFTCYDVTIKGERHWGLRKRGAILLIAKALAEEGINPEGMSKVITWRPASLWLRVQGEVDADTFAVRAMQQAQVEGSIYRPKRWFRDDTDLIRMTGHTYAISNRWGRRWQEAMDRLAQGFPQLQIQYEPSNGSPEADDSEDADE